MTLRKVTDGMKRGRAREVLPGMEGLMKEIITFFISGREYGIEIGGMQSLEPYCEISPLSEAPECILGTIVIRDEVFPVYDIRARLNLPESEMSRDTKILLLRTRKRGIACMVDSVGKVFQAEGDNIQTFPRVARTEGTDYIDFIARKDGELIVVINPDALLSEKDFELIDELDLSQEEKQE